MQKHIKTYSGYYTDPNKLLQSASGGAANILAEMILRRGGVVFGVTYSPDFKGAEYCCIEKEDELHRLKGSKYIAPRKKILVDGEYRGVYAEVGKRLKDGREVLFVGLGCTITALYSLLKIWKIDTTSLYTVELICHGTTYPKVAEEYVTGLEKKYGAPVNAFTVRYKKEGWLPVYIRAEFQNGKIFELPFYHSEYGYAFSIFLSHGCYSCQFRNENHPGDIVIGDFAGIHPDMPNYNRNGVSIILILTEKGDTLFQQIDQSVFRLHEESFEYAIANNPMYVKSATKTKNWERFKKTLDTAGLVAAVREHQGAYRYFCFVLRRNLIEFLPVCARRWLREKLQQHRKR